jgi:hypothetical protein
VPDVVSRKAVPPELAPPDVVDPIRLPEESRSTPLSGQ